MKPSTENIQHIESLRERKKAKTHTKVQKQALRLFREKGYGNTTVEQIAEAAEVSPSTFFRYFSTKEDVVMYNIIDSVVIESLKAQPVGLSPIQAIRVAIKLAYDGFTIEESADDLQERTKLMRMVPELRAKMLDKLTQNLEVLAKLTAERVGRSADDIAVRSFAGAVIGVIISVFFQDDENIKANLVKHIDIALTQLEAGLPL